MRSEYFVVQEFVNPEVYQKFGENSWWFVDARIVEGAHLLRSILGPITINNWHVDGPYKESGLRSFASSTGASMSQHKFGRAIDIKVQNMRPEEVLKFIKHNWLSRYIYKFFTTIEDIEFTKTWVHLDCRFVGDDTAPLIVKP